MFDDVDRGRSHRQRPAWLAPTTVVLSVAGLLVSAYLSYEHFTDNATLACTIGGVVDCAKVTTSAWRTFMGVPVALLGLVFFVVDAGPVLAARVAPGGALARRGPPRAG